MTGFNSACFYTSDSCSAAADTCASLRNVTGTAEILAVSVCVIGLLARIILVISEEIP